MMKKGGGIGGRLPRRYKNKHGKEIGPYYWRTPGRNGKDINLQTKDGDEAIRRMKLARKGQRVFESDGGGAAAAIAAAVSGTGGITSPVVEPAVPAASGFSPQAVPPTPGALPPTHTAPPALPPAEPAAGPERPADSAAGPSAVKPDGYIPPPPGWAEKVGEAAGAAGPDPGAAPDLDPEFLNQVVGVVADVVVELQIGLQAWLIKRRAKLEAGQVPPDDKARELGRNLWIAALKKMFPDIPDIPEWLLAPLVIAALTVPRQLQDAKPIKPDAEGAEAPVAAAA